jgi:hypothetical protein
LTLTEFFELAQQMSAARRFHDLPVLSHEALQVTAQQMRRENAERERMPDEMTLHEHLNGNSAVCAKGKTSITSLIV